MWDVDFSLATHNRSGKYFTGREFIRSMQSEISDVYYWRVKLDAPPTGWQKKLIGRAEWIEQQLRSWTRGGSLLLHRPSRPVVHLDPASVVISDLRSSDLVLCHDMGPVTHPWLFGIKVPELYHRAYSKIAEAGARVVFVSESTRLAYQKLYGEPEYGRVIYPSIRPEVRSNKVCNKVCQRPFGEGPFILSVGAIGHRKNQTRLIDAFEMAGLQARGYKLVLCGAHEPGSEEVVYKAQATGGVVLLNYVTADELAWLYDNAIGFALVSLLEGFGLPVAEAVSCGLLPLVAKDSVMEEVAGPSALCADPTNTREIAQGLLELVDLTPADRSHRIALAQQWSQKFAYQNFVTGWKHALLDTGQEGPPASHQTTELVEAAG
jgi:glycosyltransferase involved in cell wall biosynthesis